MAVKHVKEYYLKVANDYHMMNQTLEELEKCITNDNAKIATQNIDVIRQQVAQLKENYLRIAYIMFLLDMPNRPEKQQRYAKREIKKLNAIPDEHKMLGVLRENKRILNNLQSLIKN